MLLASDRSSSGSPPFVGPNGPDHVDWTDAFTRPPAAVRLNSDLWIVGSAITAACPKPFASTHDYAIASKSLNAHDTMTDHGLGLASLSKVSTRLQSDAGSASCSGGSDNDVEPETDYRLRCRQLEVSLVKFKEKATRIRELLSIKMQDMEAQVLEANKRAAQAEDRCQELESRLSGFPGPMMMSSSQERSIGLSNDYSTIVELRAQLQEQRDLRAMDARMVAEKSTKIRDWVARKIHQMETRNQQLANENASLREEVERMDDCLKRSVQPPNQQDIVSNGWHELASPAQSTETDVANLDDNSDYQEVLDDSDSCGSNSTTALAEPHKAVAKCAPRIHIERKQFNDTCDVMALSTASSITSNCQEQCEPLLIHPGSMSNKSADYDNHTPVELTPKEPPSPLTPFLPCPPPNTPGTDAAHSTVAVTLPRCKKDSQRFFAADNGNQNNTGTVLAYGDVMTIDRKYKGQAKPKPPAPPARRIPSWESRIYSMISTGLQFPSQSLVSGSGFPQKHGEMKADAGILVPVYATLKGRVTRIRSCPFTGNSSSDSSEDENDNIARTPHFDFPHPKSFMSDKRVDVANKNDRLSQKSQPDSAVKPQRISHEGSYSSLASETSSDYAFPPEDGCSIRTASSEIGLLTKSISEECGQTAIKKELLNEKSGYLLKLSSKSKVWKHWWFELKKGKLNYYKSQDSLQTPGHCIKLDSSTRLSRIEAAPLIFQITTSKRTIYIAASSAGLAKQWFHVLRCCVSTLSNDWSTPHVNLRVKDNINGWLVKVKNGRRKRCWCSLVGKNLMCYRAPNDQAVMEEFSLQGCRVEEIVHSNDSDSDSSLDITTSESSLCSKFTVAIWRPDDCPTYLLLSTNQQKVNWLYELTVACSGGWSCKTGSDFEQVISQLMAADGDSGSRQWHDPIMLHSKDIVLLRPLTSLHSDDLQRKALEMFKMIRAFTWTIIDPAQCDPSVGQAQSIFSEALRCTELQTELYCQLIKQTSKHPAQTKTPGVQHFLLCGTHSWFQCDTSPTSPTGYVVDVPESKFNPAGHVFVQGWQLLTMAISLFLPSHTVLWLLKLHLQRNADSRTESGKYAVFCQCALERSLRNGARKCRPSRLEVLSILLRNPYYHSQPISIPVHFANGSYQVVSFDGSTTVFEFLGSLEKAIGVRDSRNSGFSLCADNPVDSSLENWLPSDIKLCDVISTWEKDYTQSTGKSYDATKTIRLSYKCRMYFSKKSRLETEKERVFLVYQTNGEVVAGRFPVSRDLACELAALMAQLEYGDFKSASESGSSNLLLKQAVDNFYPVCYRPHSLEDVKQLEHRVADAWLLLKGKGSVDCVRVYLAVARKWAFFGAKLFPAELKRSDATGKVISNGPPKAVWLAVYEHGIAVLDITSMMMSSAHSYSNIVTFGGHCNDLLIVVLATDSSHRQKSQHLLFSLSKFKISEATELIASYINVLEGRKSEATGSRCSWKK